MGHLQKFGRIVCEFRAESGAWVTARGETYRRLLGRVQWSDAAPTIAS
jgi:hypothetical protein